MIKILFMRSKKAFLPEINAYIDYFNRTQEFSACDVLELREDYKFTDFDVIWEFKGFGGIKVEDKILVHEYTSLSTGTFPKLKNLLKSKLNPKPNLRIFLNEDVKFGFYFNDSIDYCLRDMGIDEKFLKVKNTKKEYDFVYVGPITREREIHKLLQKFTKKRNGKFCLVGNVQNDIYNKYKNNNDLIFTGKVPYSEVPEIASKAVYGINFIPNKYPFNIQTSTKLLEYLALGLKVITTDYKWIRQFERKHNCSFYKLNYNNIDIDITNINKYNFISNFNAKNFLWNKVIEQSKIKEKLLLLKEKG